MEQTSDVRPTPFMTCAECGLPAPWNPTTFCSWACFQVRPRDPDSGSPAPSYFFGLGTPALLHHHRNP
ncbi:hypothetical protein OG689_39660 [Kitasatospora sp. NBC_00240]|uniref:hypothetical protein n=1 Tax=Kitasatospora sp. NBC_00240 TaxID=2903567 RepID=UPI00225722BD|nr:hypothetical protein [Kitasatospora sp. NBC_00240]MCX5215301.1 hypothetical protein [Kitasatospora sp. NBC_00240]